GTAPGTGLGRRRLSWLWGLGGASPARTRWLERMAVTADPAGEAIAARVTSGDGASVYLLRPGEAPARDSRACGVLEYQTNARVIHFRTRGDSLVALDLVDASHALPLRDGWIS